jgi:hypothetical protein
VKEKIFFHGNFESVLDWPSLTEEWEIFSLWEFLKETNPTSWEMFVDMILNKLSSVSYKEAAGYSLGGRVLLGLVDHGFRAKELSFFSTHSGLNSEEERNKRVRADLTWKEKTLTEEWPELFADWNSQAIFADSTKPYEPFGKLEPFRNEIAQAFDILGLGRMPNFSALKFPKDAKVQWVCGQHDHKFRSVAESFCRKHPKINYLVAFNEGHRMPRFIAESLS